MVVFGTRPEVIKLASFLKEVKSVNYDVVLVNVGQHIDLTEQALNVFGLKSDYNLKIMETKQSLSKITRRVITKLDRILDDVNPDTVVVMGDTNTAFGAALCAYYHKKKIVHIEGGARSYDKYNSFPEEINRRLIDHIADLNTCQTQLDVDRLGKEGIYNGVFVGNTSLDVINMFIDKVITTKKVLVTMHRREGWGEPMKQACMAIKGLALEYPDHEFIIARHPNPTVFDMFTKVLDELDNVKLVDALPFDIFIRHLASCKLVMTDSGGVIQEAIFLRKPIVHMRDKSEYEHLFDGTYLVSTGKNMGRILKAGRKLLDKKNPKCKEITEFGDGNAGKKIAEMVI